MILLFNIFDFSENMEDIPNKALIDDKYLIIKKLSYGGQANIFLVKEKESGEIYVAKIPIEDDSFLSSEINILQYLKDNNVPYIINKVDDGNGEIVRKNHEPVEISYIILEYAKNRDLEQYIRFPKTGFGENLSKIIFYRIAKSIEAIHEKETCHRDIKLDNILLDDDYHPKLSDFGLATHNSDDLTDYAGTPGYMAPEITEGGKYDGFKVDIFSLGVTLFRLTLGISPFTDAQGENSIYNLIKKKYNDLYWKFISIKENNSEEINNVSDEFKKLYNKMVSSVPSERPSMEEILEDEWFGDIKNMDGEALDDYENYCNGSLMVFFDYLYAHWRISKIKTGSKAYSFYALHTYRELSQCVGLLVDTSAQRTVHKAKGDEFDNVLVIFTEEKALNVLLNPDIRNKESDRVYYVAMSRARNRLFLTIPSLSSQKLKELNMLPIDIMRIN